MTILCSCPYLTQPAGQPSIPHNTAWIKFVLRPVWDSAAISFVSMHTPPAIFSLMRNCQVTF
jgi:hypothetical protein